MDENYEQTFTTQGSLIPSENEAEADIKELEGATLNLSRSVIVKCYAPKTFEKIRALNNITDEHLIESLDPGKNIKQIQNAGEGAGASGSFFFFTQDKRFIMKTMSEKEINHMIRALPHYYEHLDNNEKCFMAKIFGIYTVQIDSFDPIHVMIMQNSIPHIDKTELHYVFDMKGSSINREVLKHISA